MQREYPIRILPERSDVDAVFRGLSGPKNSALVLLRAGEAIRAHDVGEKALVTALSHASLPQEAHLFLSAFRRVKTTMRLAGASPKAVEMLFRAAALQLVKLSELNDIASEIRLDPSLFLSIHEVNRGFLQTVLDGIAILVGARVLLAQRDAAKASQGQLGFENAFCVKLKAGEMAANWVNHYLNGSDIALGERAFVDGIMRGHPGSALYFDEILPFYGDAVLSAAYHLGIHPAQVRAEASLSDSEQTIH